MRWLIIMFLLTCGCTQLHAQVNIITTICGNDTAGYNGDGGLAVKAKLNKPCGICLDKQGRIYIADAINHAIRKIDPLTGVITTIAGKGVPGFSGDSGPATASELSVPSGIVIDTFGNVYIADGGNNRIRKITLATGIITTVAGSGPTGVSFGGDSGDGGAATNATLNLPVAVHVDKMDNIYIADYLNNKIRKVDVETGIITRVAGNGSSTYPGDGQLATTVGISGPLEVFTDRNGNIFFCDQWNHSVRKVDVANGVIATLAGIGIEGYSGDNGPAIQAALNQPSGMYVDDRNDIYISDYGNGTIRKVDGLTGIVTSVAGVGTSGFFGDEGPATNAKLRCSDVVVDHYGSMFICDYENERIRMVRDTMLRVGVKDVIPKGRITVFPNPANNELTVSGITTKTEYRIINITGVEITKGICTESNSSISVHYLIPGIYLLELTDNNGQRNIVRVVKE